MTREADPVKRQTVILPRDQRPRFPSRCIECGAPSPDGTAGIAEGAFPYWWAGKALYADAPACGKCRSRLRTRARLRTIADTCAVVGVTWVSIRLVGGGEDKLSILTKGLMLAGGVVLISLWRFAFPPKFDFWESGSRVKYRFRDPAYAEEFCARNNAPDAPPADGAAAVPPVHRHWKARRLTLLQRLSVPNLVVLDRNILEELEIADGTLTATFRSGRRFQARLAELETSLSVDGIGRRWVRMRANGRSGRFTEIPGTLSSWDWDELALCLRAGESRMSRIVRIVERAKVLFDWFR